MLPATDTSKPAGGVAAAPCVRVALVCHSYPPVLGGSEIEAQRVASALNRRGHRVEVLCAGGPPMPDLRRWIDPAGVPVRLYGGRFRGGALRDYAYAGGVVGTLLREGRRFDIIYFLMSGLHLATALPVAHALGRPVIMKFSGSSTIRQLSNSSLGRLELALLRRWADRILLLNDGMAEEAAEARFAAARVLWMPNPVDPDEFRPPAVGEREALRVRFDIPAAAPVLIYVGRIAPEKELPSALAAFARILPRWPEALFVLAGDGPDRPALEARARELGISASVRFTGRLPIREVAEWLRAADAFVLASSLEGLPCSLIEAMSAGLPAAVSDIPANTQLIAEGETGTVAAVRDPAALAAAMERLLADAPFRLRAGSLARATAIASFSIETVVTRYEALFSELMAGRGRQSGVS